MVYCIVYRVCCPAAQPVEGVQGGEKRNPVKCETGKLIKIDAPKLGWRNGTVSVGYLGSEWILEVEVLGHAQVELG